MNDEQTLRRLEEQLLDPHFRKSRAVEELIADSFLEFGSSGRTYDKRQVIEFLRNETPAASASIGDFHATELTDGVALITFRAIQQRNGERVESLRSSIWKQVGGARRLLFHQGTRVP